jgi:rare lipoprotein A (peptidoglycan hydrolase)
MNMKAFAHVWIIMFMLCATSIVDAQTKSAPTSVKPKDTLTAQCKKETDKAKQEKCGNMPASAGDEIRAKNACMKAQERDALEYQLISNKAGSKKEPQGGYCENEEKIKKRLGEECGKCTKGVSVISRPFSDGIKIKACKEEDGSPQAVKAGTGKRGEGTFRAFCREDYENIEKKKVVEEGGKKKDLGEKKSADLVGKSPGEQEGTKLNRTRKLSREDAQALVGTPETGKASRYGDGSAMDGSIVTSSGALRDNDRYSMASQHYPDGTVGVMTGPNGKEIAVVVNNSGDFNRFGRQYDLTPAAAEAIGITKTKGVGDVTFTSTYVPEYSTYKKGRTDYVQGFTPAQSVSYIRGTVQSASLR